MCPQEHKGYAVKTEHHKQENNSTKRYGVSPYVSLATRALVRGQPRSGLLCVLCKLM